MCKRHVMAYDNQHLHVSSWDNFMPEIVFRECPRDFKKYWPVGTWNYNIKKKNWGIRRDGDIPQERSTLTWIQSPFGKYFILGCPMSTNIALPAHYDSAYRVTAVEPNIETALGKTEHHLFIWYFTSRETFKFSTVQWFLKQVQTTLLHEVFTWALTFLL